MNTLKLYVLTALCIVFALLFTLKSCELKKAQQFSELNRVPDTVYVPTTYKVVEIKKQYIEKPVKVFVYLKDTTLRKQAERSDIITGIDFKRHSLFRKLDFITIDKINPQGIVMSNTYEVPPLRELKIDLNGNLHTKKKRYIGLKIVAGVVLTSASIYVVRNQIKQ